ncbi:MAG TPA: DUF58 domain-containing protein [Pseudomonadales bacterium]|nr:DUF58 domain-containing protein [Pseudomonadales bacterium]
MLQWADKVPASWKQRYTRWLNHRIPVKSSVSLSQKNLFIFLGKQGLYFLLLILLVWIGATNFQSNLAHALAYLLLAVIFVAILQTFANMSGLRIRFIDAEPVFAGETASVRFEFASSSAHQQLEMFWPGQSHTMINLEKTVGSYIFLQHQTHRRGVFAPGRFCLQTYFPLGIVRCWTWLDLAANVIVYPEPQEADFHECVTGEGDEGTVAVHGSDEYFSLKPYTEGESLSRIAWKQYAAGRGMFVRDYTELKGGSVWLDFNAMTDANTETKLSKLCYCALQLQQLNRPYGLKLPAQTIDVATGDAHLRTVLRALALYA